MNELLEVALGFDQPRCAAPKEDCGRADVEGQRQPRLSDGFARGKQREAVRVRQAIPADGTGEAGRLPRARRYLAGDVRSLCGVVEPIEGSDGRAARSQRLAKRPDAPSGGGYGTHAG